MIKIFIISLCLFVSNCAYISYNQVIPLARNAILGVEKIKVDEYQNSNYYTFMKDLELEQVVKKIFLW